MSRDPLDPGLRHRLEDERRREDQRVWEDYKHDQARAARDRDERGRRAREAIRAGNTAAALRAIDPELALMYYRLRGDV